MKQKKIIPKELEHLSEGQLRRRGLWDALPDAPAEKPKPEKPKTDKPA